MLTNSDFKAYIGGPDIHDGVIASIHYEGDRARVLIKAINGRVLSIEFQGVESMEQNGAEGMMLYALTETKAIPPLRRFVFSNLARTIRPS